MNFKKNLIIIISVLTMCLSLVSCGTTNNSANKDNSSNSTNDAMSKSVVYTINVKQLVENPELVPEALKNANIIPSDGILFNSLIDFSEKQTAFDLLVEISKKEKIPIDFSGTSANGDAFIKSIKGIENKAAGDLSGWMYFVNGEMSNVGAAKYELKGGDSIEWKFVTDYNNP
ncbi:MAG: DUF4430 domain-containing protein [Oscillospiraceae bacterium]|nr:DUF4430 domain-containing protein [Oscillospiraceae bacterium]